MSNKEKIKNIVNDLDNILHSKDISELNRGLLVGTLLLYLKETVKEKEITKDVIKTLDKYWSDIDILKNIKDTITTTFEGNEDTLNMLNRSVFDKSNIKTLNDSDYKEILIYLLKNVLTLNTITENGQNLLNLFFIMFNQYVNKKNKNQVFTPDHIAKFICEILEVDKTKKVLDATCGTGAFLIQAMLHELSDCNNSEELENVAKNNIYGIEIDEDMFSLSTMNMLVLGNGNSNIKLNSLFDSGEFIEDIEPDVILMNPPYNASAIPVPDKYKESWSKKAKDDPTKGLVFVEFVADYVKTKEAKLAVIIPVACSQNQNKAMKTTRVNLLKKHTLEAVFTLPTDLFYPSASVSTCCMIFTLNKPHSKNKETLFTSFENDEFNKTRNGRVELFDKDNKSKWKKIEEKWIDLYLNKKEIEDLSVKDIVTAEDSWLYSSHIKINTTPTEDDFKKTVSDYLAWKVSNILKGQNFK